MGVLYRDKYEINTMMMRILKVKRKNSVECMIAPPESAEQEALTLVGAVSLLKLRIYSLYIKR